MRILMILMLAGTGMALGGCTHHVYDTRDKVAVPEMSGSMPTSSNCTYNHAPISCSQLP